MNEERERKVAADARRRVIADCAALLPLARSACAAMDEEDEAEVLRLFCGESQKRTLRRLGRLIDDLSLCRTAADLPGPKPEVIELRNASFRVFRGLSVRAGNPLNLAKRFRSGAVDFFRMLVRQDPMLLQLVHRGPWRRFAYDLLFAALKANQYLLQLRQVPSALLRPLRSPVRFHSTEDRERTTEIPNGKLEVLNRTIRHEHERTRREIVKSINARNIDGLDITGPRTPECRDQVFAVVAWLANPKHLQNIHHACDRTYHVTENGYDNKEKLYLWCHRNESRIWALVETYRLNHDID